MKEDEHGQPLVVSSMCMHIQKRQVCEDRKETGGGIEQRELKGFENEDLPSIGTRGLGEMLKMFQNEVFDHG